ncbi:hypothetical protein M9H77_03762 [Catharanthus roseus]|uniref:Uncharacterized protein n=1 Tax=Catharanthus roseus TaxID=4058 RepID=A0ACC0CC61_CATRO|nr:hypothetical protein M9H77_03762 [Catharanthus roseus]
MRVSTTAGKSERIKTHQHSFYAPKFKKTCNVIVGLHGQSPDPQTRPSEPSYKLLGHLPGLPWDQPQFCTPPDSPLGGRTLSQSMMRCTGRPIGPHPPLSTPLFNWIHSSKSEVSTPSEEALVRGTSHV